MDIINLICKSDYSAGKSLIVVILSMLYIFAVLVFLMGVMFLTPVVLKWVEKRRAKPQAEAAPEVFEESGGEDEEVVAAITAAITHVRQEENARAPFVIKKIKRN